MIIHLGSQNCDMRYITFGIFFFLLTIQSCKKDSPSKCSIAGENQLCFEGYAYPLSNMTWHYSKFSSTILIEQEIPTVNSTKQLSASLSLVSPSYIDTDTPIVGTYSSSGNFSFVYNHFFQSYNGSSLSTATYFYKASSANLVTITSFENNTLSGHGTSQLTDVNGNEYLATFSFKDVPQK